MTDIINSLLDAAAKATQGEWHYGCLADDATKCQCPYILHEGYAGSIATVSIDNGKRVSDGGNDSPPIEEAKANLRYMVLAQPQNIIAIIDYTRKLEEALKPFSDRFEWWVRTFDRDPNDLSEIMVMMSDLRRAKTVLGGGREG